MGIQHACMRGETRCMRACGDPACAYAHGGLAWAWGSSVHGQRISAVHACAWRPGACMHGDPACVHGDPVCARMGILCACVRAWGPGACTHGHPACVTCVRGDPVHARMGIVRAWTWSMHVQDPACTVGTRCVRAGIRYGCEDPVGTGRRSIPCMKAWEPACNVFAMKKGCQ